MGIAQLRIAQLGIAHLGIAHLGIDDRKTLLRLPVLKDLPGDARAEVSPASAIDKKRLSGNIFALATLIHSKNLGAPTFLYHKALLFASTIFCANYFFNYAVNKFACYQWPDVPKNATTDHRSTRLTQVKNFQYLYHSWHWAFYTGIVFHVLQIACSYMIQYMSLIIVVERFSAFHLCRFYEKFDKKSTAKYCILFCIFLSLLLHSWAPWVQRKVVELDSSTVNKSHQVLKTFDSKIFTWIRRQRVAEHWSIKIKDFYNTCFRVIYPILTCLLTSGVIYGFVKWNKRLRIKYGRIVKDVVVEETQSGSYGAIISTPFRRHQTRYEKTLFLFMIAAVVLSFMQISVSEARRLLTIIYPASKIIVENIADGTKSANERLYYVKILLYGHQIGRLISNLMTALNQSVLCYSYVLMNKLFRNELWAMLK